MTFMRKIPMIVFLSFSNLWTLSLAVSKVSENGYVEIPNGALQGQVNSDHLAFYHVPFAKAPVKELRWQPPQDPENWSGVKHVEENNHLHCPQLLSSSNNVEDCLFLNIYMPKPSEIEKSTSKKRAVLAWIYGGAFRFGSSESAIYEAGRLAEQEGVIVVTINYRLASFGFSLDTENLESAAGNQGIKDQIKGLEWVQKNIEFFYGDPRRVTIYGQSAGGQSVATILSLREPRNELFNSAIPHSAPLGLPYKTKEEATKESGRLLRHLNCTSEPDPWVCARSKTMEEVVIAEALTRSLSNQAISSIFEEWSPAVDGDLLDKQPMLAIMDGRTAHKPVMYGFTDLEAAVFAYEIFRNPMGKFLYETIVNVWFGKDSDKVLQQYPSTCSAIDRHCDERELASKLLTSYLFDCPTKKAMLVGRVQKKSSPLSQPTFKYLFDQPVQQLAPTNSSKEICSISSCHGAEVPFIFQSFESLNWTPTDTEMKLSKKMIKYWTQFAYSNDPNVPESGVQENDYSLTYWHEFSDSDEDSENKFYTQVLDDGTINSVDPLKLDADCDFWDGIDIYLEH